MRLAFQGKIWWCPEFPIAYIRHHSDRLALNEKLLHKLKKSIEAVGMRNPLFGQTVNNAVQVGPGKQRLRAAIELGWTTVPVLVWDLHGIVPNLRVSAMEVPPEVAAIESYYDDNHHVDVASLRKGTLAIKKTLNWRDEN